MPRFEKIKEDPEFAKVVSEWLDYQRRQPSTRSDIFTMLADQQREEFERQSCKDDEWP